MIHQEFKMPAIFILKKKLPKWHKLFISLEGHYFVMGCSFNMNVGVFWETSMSFLKSVALQIFSKHSQSYANLNLWSTGRWAWHSELTKQIAKDITLTKNLIWKYKNKSVLYLCLVLIAGTSNGKIDWQSKRWQETYTGKYSGGLMNPNGGHLVNLCESFILKTQVNYFLL